MTHNHRRWHAWAWLVLGPLLAVGFVVGLLARPTAVAEPAPLPAPGDAPKAGIQAPPREATP